MRCEDSKIVSAFVSSTEPRAASPQRKRAISSSVVSARRWARNRSSSKSSSVVDVNGPLIVDDADLMIRAAIDGLGLTFSFEEYAVSHIENGTLVRVLEDWCPPFPEYFLYYPSRRQQPAALSALIDTLRLEDRHK